MSDAALRVAVGLAIHHGYERVAAARDAAREILDDLNKPE